MLDLKHFTLEQAKLRIDRYICNDSQSRHRHLSYLNFDAFQS
jgi:hypothetical protein